jgi:hypothetical protein
MDSMRRIECICDVSLPRLAWCAVLTESDNTFFVHHGSWIELDDSSFVEGAWSGPYIKMGFPHALTFTGSGATVTSDGVLFATPTHSVDSLYVLRVGKRLHCSNSLRHVLASADDDIDPSYMFYDVDINLYKFGIEPPPTARVPTRNRNWVTIHRCCNFIVGKDLTVSLLPKRHRGAFRDYSDYRIFVNEQVLLTIENSADPQRSIRYIPLSTISTGYDSTAVSVIARAAGCREYLTFHTASDGSNDSGKRIGHILGLNVSEYDPDAYHTRNDLPEAEFAATGGSGGSVVMTACEQELCGKMLLTGHYGDEIWERANEDRTDTVTGAAGSDMIYFRTRVGFLHLPVPSIGYSEFISIKKIANSREMCPWRLQRSEYDRPIPRRIAEEVGVPSELFGQRKKIVVRSLRSSGAVVIGEPDLNAVMAPNSYRNFSQWTEQTSLFSNAFDRWSFALLHKLYWFNVRVIRSRKVRTAAKHLRIAVPTRSWIPARFAKQRVRHRLLFHWGMEQIKVRYSSVSLSYPRRASNDTSGAGAI